MEGWKFGSEWVKSVSSSNCEQRRSDDTYIICPCLFMLDCAIVLSRRRTLPPCFLDSLFTFLLQNPMIRRKPTLIEMNKEDVQTVRAQAVQEPQALEQPTKNKNSDKGEQSGLEPGIFDAKSTSFQVDRIIS